VLERARALAAAPFAWPEAPPDAIGKLSAADYAMIGFREEHRLFVDPPTGFAVELLHPGFIYSVPVEIFVVDGGISRRIAYDPALFNFGNVPPPESAAGLEFAGFRALTALNQPDVLQPFAIYAGASYFKAVSKGQTFGLSARGLAIGTGEAEGEEFPFFRAHWLEPPGEGRLVVHSLLDGPSAAGAYRFTIRPGDPTQIDVEATIFAREDIAHLGLAPLTSMFLFDAKDRAEHDDFRLGVHDSDGLAMWNGQDERLWRPLHSPRLLQISAFADSGPRGFGLVQRERSFADYEDLTAAYHRRPSAWVEPIGDWGKGHVVLVEIPSSEEIHDNVVAYWRPEADVAKGDEISLTYRLSWGWDSPDLAGLLRVERTLSGAGDDGRRRFVVDFAGDAPNPIRASAVQLVAQANPGSLDDAQISENPEVNGLRLSIELDPEGADSVEMRVELRSGDRRIAETWVYRWSS
ncbi:MAG TPA: glucan biosynthesis protein G, partial [Amaricoccus sp.]|nr:glucan biosynthesis protein G [Amaricoccus sp.]